MTATCETCRWWDKQAEGHVYANCRRMPPRPKWGVSIQAKDQYRNPDVSVYSRPEPEWPNTHEDDWGTNTNPRSPPHDPQ